MRIFDFIVQSLLLLCALGSLAFGKEALIFIALAQFGMGCWQLLSAIVNTFNRDTPFKKAMLLYYWIAVGVYFLVMGAIALLDSEPILFTWFFCAWIIAIFYYIVTIRLAFVRDNGSRSFLDIANE